jgi:hypothetical protein
MEILHHLLENNCGVNFTAHGKLLYWSDWLWQQQLTTTTHTIHHYHCKIKRTDMSCWCNG